MAALSGAGSLASCRDGEAETLLASLVSQHGEDPAPASSKGLEEPLTGAWGTEGLSPEWLCCCAGERFGVAQGRVCWVPAWGMPLRVISGSVLC